MMNSMPTEIQDLVNDTDFTGYVVIDYDGVFGKTKDVTKAVSWALERSKIKGLEEYVKMFYVYTMGQYAETPGERGANVEDWNSHARQLMA